MYLFDHHIGKESGYMKQKDRPIGDSAVEGEGALAAPETRLFDSDEQQRNKSINEQLLSRFLAVSETQARHKAPTQTRAKAPSRTKSCLLAKWHCKKRSRVENIGALTMTSASSNIGHKEREVDMLTLGALLLRVRCNTFEGRH